MTAQPTAASFAAEPVRAKDVQVRKLFRAECARPDCGWRGAEYPTFAEASAERLGHLKSHAQIASTTAPAGGQRRALPGRWRVSGESGHACPPGECSHASGACRCGQHRECERHGCGCTCHD